MSYIDSAIQQAVAAGGCYVATTGGRQMIARFHDHYGRDDAERETPWAFAPGEGDPEGIGVLRLGLRVERLSNEFNVYAHQRATPREDQMTTTKKKKPKPKAKVMKKVPGTRKMQKKALVSRDRDVVEAAAELCKVEYDEVIGPHRFAAAVKARRYVCFYLRERRGRSLWEITDAIGRNCHTTACSALNCKAKFPKAQVFKEIEDLCSRNDRGARVEVAAKRLLDALAADISMRLTREERDAANALRYALNSQ